MKIFKYVGLPIVLLLAIGLMFAACSSDDNGDDSPSRVVQPSPIILIDEGNEIEIEISRTQPHGFRSVITPQDNDFFIVRHKGIVISFGTITVDDNGIITFKPAESSPIQTSFTGTFSGSTMVIEELPILDADGKEEILDDLKLKQEDLIRISGLNLTITHPKLVENLLPAQVVPSVDGLAGIATKDSHTWLAQSVTVFSGGSYADFGDLDSYVGGLTKYAATGFVNAAVPRLAIVLKAADGYYFHQNMAFDRIIINGTPLGAATSLEVTDDGKAAAILWVAPAVTEFTVTEASKIKSVGISFPSFVAGNNLPENPTITGGAELVSVAWSGDASAPLAVAGKTYTATVTLAPQPGRIFAVETGEAFAATYTPEDVINITGITPNATTLASTGATKTALEVSFAVTVWIDIRGGIVINFEDPVHEGVAQNASALAGLNDPDLNELGMEIKQADTEWDATTVSDDFDRTKTAELTVVLTALPGYRFNTTALAADTGVRPALVRAGAGVLSPWTVDIDEVAAGELKVIFSVDPDELIDSVELTFDENKIDAGEPLSAVTSPTHDLSTAVDSLTLTNWRGLVGGNFTTANATVTVTIDLNDGYRFDILRSGITLTAPFDGNEGDLGFPTVSAISGKPAKRLVINVTLTPGGAGAVIPPPPKTQVDAVTVAITKASAGAVNLSGIPSTSTTGVSTTVNISWDSADADFVNDAARVGTITLTIANTTTHEWDTATINGNAAAAITVNGNNTTSDFKDLTSVNATTLIFRVDVTPEA